MKFPVLAAVLLSSSLSHAGLRSEVPVVDCAVEKIEQPSSAQGVVENDSEVTIHMLYEGNEFIGYKARIGELSFPILTGGGRSALTSDSISREDVGYGEAFKIVEAETERRIVVLKIAGSETQAELYVGSVHAEAVPLTATLQCK